MLAEAARFRGYPQSAWEAEDFRCKARVVAHYLEHSIREGYAMEKAKKLKDGGKDKASHDKFFRHRQSTRAPVGS